MVEKPSRPLRAPCRRRSAGRPGEAGHGGSGEGGTDDRRYPERPVVGIGVVLWREGKVALIRRGKPPRAGQWSLPGGAQKLGETVLAAAVREVREETGLELVEPRIVEVVDLLERDEAGRVRYHYTLIEVTGRARGGEGEAGGDAAALAWFDPEEVAAMPLWEETKRVVRKAAEMIGEIGPPSGAAGRG